MNEAVKVGTSIGDAKLLARTQILAGFYRLVFDAWREEDAELCFSAHEVLRGMGDTGTRTTHEIIYAHVLTLRGKYREAVEIFDPVISRVDQGTSAIVRYLALLGKTLALLQTGRLGDVLRIARGERALAEKNGSAPWMFDFREAWVRTLVFDFEGARKICEMIGTRRRSFFCRNCGPWSGLRRVRWSWSAGNMHRLWNISGKFAIRR